MKALKTIFTLIFLSIMTTVGGAQAKDITLSWEASPSSGVDGYHVYCAEGVEQPEPPFELCGETAELTLTVADLDDGRWWFAVTAFNTTGESAYSNIVGEEAVPGVPGTLKIQTVVNVTVNVNQ